MKYISAMLLAVYALLTAAVVVHAEQQRIVVVVSAGSSIRAISAMEVRHAYLGATIVLDGVAVKPLRNQTDQLSGEVFLQKILFMSAEAYERQLLTRVFRGGVRPPAYTHFPDLLSALQHDNATITFMLYETAISTPGIRIIGDL